MTTEDFDARLTALTQALERTAAIAATTAQSLAETRAIADSNARAIEAGHNETAELKLLVHSIGTKVLENADAIAEFREEMRNSWKHQAFNNKIYNRVDRDHELRIEALEDYAGIEPPPFEE